jgi:L-aspartate oxidase
VNIKSDVLIVGSGAAGLTLALNLADHRKVTLISKETLVDSSTWYAQGGIAAVLAKEDTVESHIQDTLKVGDGICDEQAVRFTIENSKAAIEWLIDMGVEFTRTADGTDYHLTQEGGHSQRRVIHSDDTTGREISDSLAQRVRQHQNITVYEKHLAVDLIKDGERCLGAYILERATGLIKTFSASHTVLATGGASKVYFYTSNPDGASGDGYALAARAGCRLANMEFNQFHPTCLYHPQAKSFLLSEALRGEGAILRLPDGEAFMERFDVRGDLASRDIVARSIDFEMKRSGLNHVMLDMTHADKSVIQQKFPSIFETCLSFGYDMSKVPVPVVPAAHYTCGGVMVDLSGKTDIDRLYAIGEVSYTGLHGANRMASNSLLECIVFGKAAAEVILNDDPIDQPELPLWDSSMVVESDEKIIVNHNWNLVRRLMWDYVGIVRSNKRLAKAAAELAAIQAEVEDYYWNFSVTSDLIELRNLTQVAEHIIKSAQLRKESRGLHFSIDHPKKMNLTEPTVIKP